MPQPLVRTRILSLPDLEVLVSILDSPLSGFTRLFSGPEGFVHSQTVGKKKQQMVQV